MHAIIISLLVVVAQKKILTRTLGEFTFGRDFWHLPTIDSSQSIQSFTSNGLEREVQFVYLNLKNRYATCLFLS